MQRRKYSTEFKREAVELASGVGVNLSEVARDLGINPGMLGRWRKEFKTERKTAFKGQGVARDEEMARLRRELTRIKKERDLLTRFGFPPISRRVS